MERTVRVVAGAFTLLSLALGYWVSDYWFLFTIFVGANLFQSGFTRWCLAENLIAKLGFFQEARKTSEK